MIAGDHDHLDSGGAAALDGLWHLGSRRVMQSDEAGQSEAGLGRSFALLQLAECEAKYPQPLLCHAILGQGHLLPPRLIQRHLDTADFDAVT